MKVSLLVSIFLSFVFVSACNSRSQEIEQQSIISDNHNDVPRKHLICSSTPPIQDLTKLKASLKERGLITEQMTEAEAEQIVVDYIRQRQKAFQDCKKGGQ
ncbi:hypothetical protein L2719_10790 [Shewanella schlegeliana]|uniref:Lipoprotein n=1 Tax=Shewanella schlegeliana TaxID=190308 RepID=A0ABS1T5D0_9GAMM|nr:hypothetical protein [Shewanella schlegeliana]MBL4915440.1 hypothetical protein [Shewanella schlegeliana]MCL1110036.1 hypothetical protein [Shewanella schlegeliana]GIU25123.1 hypothetical protein TUM4433_09510 [Shewanella schlegeliana]